MLSFLFSIIPQIKVVAKKLNQRQQHSIYSNLWPSYKSPTYRPFLFPMEFLTRLWVKIKVIVCRFTYFHHTHILSFHIYIPQMLKRKQERIHGNLFQAIDYNSSENLHNKRILHCTYKSILNMRLLKILSEYTQVIILSIFFYSDWL